MEPPPRGTRRHMLCAPIITGSPHGGGAWRRPAGWGHAPAGGSTPQGVRPAADHRVRAGELGVVEADPPARLRSQSNSWRVRTGRLDVPLQEGRVSGRAAVLPGPLPAGALRLADLGYWSLEAFAVRAPHQVFWLSRLQMQTAVYDATGDRRELLELLEIQAMDPVELAVTLGERQRLAARLFAVRVPQDVAETRRRRLRKAARDKGRQTPQANALVTMKSHRATV